MTGLWMAFKLWGGFSRIAATAGNALRYLLAHPMTAIALLAAVWGLWEHHGKASALRYAETEHTARLAQAEAVKAATAHAIALQAAQNADTARVQAERNRRTDDVVKAAETARVGAVAAYAALHRVRADAVCRSPSAGPAVPGDPGKPDEAPGAPDMVAVSRPDLDSLTDAAVQGAARYRYLEALVASGVAVVGEIPGDEPR